MITITLDSFRKSLEEDIKRLEIEKKAWEKYDDETYLKMEGMIFAFKEVLSRAKSIKDPKEVRDSYEPMRNVELSEILSKGFGEVRTFGKEGQVSTSWTYKHGDDIMGVRDCLIRKFGSDNWEAPIYKVYKDFKENKNVH